MNDDLGTLRERLAEIADLARAGGVLGWDQRVTMPPLGTEARAEALATIDRIAHDRFIDPEVGRLLDRLEPLQESLPYDSDDASLVRVTRRDWEKARRVPSELQVEMTRAAARGHHAWVEARRNNDFASFLPYLRTNVELKRRYIACFEPADSPYTALLDDYEPGMTTADVHEVFAVLRPALSELVRAAPVVDASFLHGSFDPDDQRAFATSVLATMGFDEGAWRLDPTAHPFCTSFSNRDVRLTTRYHPDNLESVWSTMHEAGHGLYAHGVADSLMRTPLSGAPSLGLNESQSRTWENLVGRSRAFWTHWYDALQETFPDQLADVELDRFVRAINRAQPGLIRTQADETTYSLHIILRFELEQQMIEGTIALEDLPQVWNARMEEFLGVDVPDDAHGVLQDVHWSGGGIGYFPTYALGNVISLQIWATVREAIPDVDDQMAAGELGELSRWLRDNLYALGRKLTPKETLARVTGSDVIDPQPYLEYLRDKQAALFPVTAAFAKPGADSIALAALERAQAIFDSCAALVRAELPAEAVLWDAHTHLGDDIDGMTGRPAELLGILAPYGFSGAFTFCLDEPDRAPAFSAANDRTLAYAAADSRFVPFVRLDLEDAPLEEAVRCLDLGARGIKLHPRAQKFSVGDKRLEPVFELAAARGVPILIHGGRGLPPIADHLAALVRRYTGTRLIIAHAGIADMAALAGHFGGVPGVYFDTSVWSAVDLLDLLRQVAPEQVLFATDYPYGRLPNALLLVLRVTRLSGLDEKQIRGVLGATAAGIAAGEPPPELSAPRGITTLVQPLTFARISQYVSMATPLLWMRQPDAAGGLGLAVNAALEEHAHVEEAEMIREALVTASELWSAVPEVADEAERRRVGDHAKWLVHIAGILAATTHG